MFFIDDFIGSLKGGPYYSRLLSRPIGKGWIYLVILMIIGSAVMTVPRIIAFNHFYNQTAGFLSTNVDSLRFSNGEIVNFPQHHLEADYDNWTIRVDTIYTDSATVRSLVADSSFKKIAAFVGPKAVFMAAGETFNVYKYPQQFNQTITGEKLIKSKIYLLPVFILLVFLVFFVMNFIGSLIYTLLIGLMVVFKFRSIGLSYKHGFHLGLYLVTLQFVISLILDLAGIALPYAIIWYVIMYIFYIGLMVNISLSNPQSGVTLSGNSNSIQ